MPYAVNHNYPMPDPECYIFLHHVKNIKGTNGVLLILPSFADNVNDSISVSFMPSNPLSRSAPIYSYQNSGPRTVQIQLDLHRDMMWQLNYQKSNMPINNVDGDDYVDALAREIQAAALPSYSVTEKMVNPPLVSLRLGNEIFIKGVISNGVQVTYGLPVLSNNRYAKVGISFGLNEVIPYGAEDIMRMGSFRGMSTTLADRNSYAPIGTPQNVNYSTIMV